MDYKTISFVKQGHIGKLIMNRPRYANAQSRVMLEEIDHAFVTAAADDDVRVVVLSGAGDHFSSGHDLGTPEEMDDRQQRPFPEGVPGEYAHSRQLFLDNTLRWRDFAKPTIAEVHGWCIFGGYMLASAMDLIVASADAKFLSGLVQYFSIPWDLSPRKAKEILFQNRVLEAEEACKLGFVNTVVPRERLEEETLALANRIAESSPFMLRMVKWSVNAAQDAMGFSTSIRSAHSHQMLLVANGGRSSFPDRRNPLVDQAQRRDKKE